jgi:hypothetical protein
MLVSFMQLTIALMPPSNVIKLVASSSFPNILIKTFYLGSIKGLTSIPDNFGFNALINSIINWLRLWIG